MRDSESFNLSRIFQVSSLAFRSRVLKHRNLFQRLEGSEKKRKETPLLGAELNWRCESERGLESGRPVEEGEKDNKRDAAAAVDAFSTINTVVPG